MVLEGEGYEVETFESAEEVLPRIGKSRIDVLLLDVRLPNMDGIELLERVKDLQPNIPVLMISGHASIEDAVKAMALGAADFMEKPLSRETVLARVKRVQNSKTN